MVSKVDAKCREKRALLKQVLAECTSPVSVTLDLWSDRTKRSFLGITAHYVAEGILHSALLKCDVFKGRLLKLHVG